MEYPFIFGTAGHIDHGKTALVRAMTGVDCDRLEEEKRRGITIELGFAPLTLASGKTLSIIDVPGHERFIRQMAAGAAGMDAAMLVIAASEGVMPQTREHLDILDILGVKFGLVALTKKDLVDEETLELATAEALEVIRGTCLEGAPIIPVSSLTGEGVPRIVEAIEEIIDKIPPRKSFGAFFLPIDRVFSKKGFGSVVTGTSYQGSIAEGDEVDIMPSGLAGKVRSLQTHGEKTSAVMAGQRVAINLSAVSCEQLERGDAVCAKGAFTATSCMNASLHVLPSAKAGIAHWQRVRLHVGTADVVARIVLLSSASPLVRAPLINEPRMSGEQGTGNGEQGFASDYAHITGNTLINQSKILPVPHHSGLKGVCGAGVQLLTELPVTVTAGQRFVIRSYSPLVTIGGGRIMLPNAERAKGKADREAKASIIEELATDFGPVPLLAAIVRDKGVLGVSGLFALSQMERKVFDEHLEQLSAAPEKAGLLEFFGASRNFISADAFEAALRAVLRLLKTFHAKYPERAGLAPENLLPALDSIHGAQKIALGDFKDILSLMAARGGIAPVEVQGKTCYRAAGQKQTVDKKLLELAGRIKQEGEAAGFNLVKLPELEAIVGASPADMKRAIKYLQENESLRVLDGGLILPLKTREALLAVLTSLEGDITVAALRDALGVNRKLSLSMLDFLDAQGLTKRDGDKRILS